MAYVTDLTKDTKILRVINGEYLVDTIIKDGIKTVRTTKDPYLATPISVEEMYKELYNSLSVDDLKEIKEAHKKGSGSYNTMIANRYTTSAKFHVLHTSSISYGYNDDLKHEAKLLKELGLGWMLEEEKVEIESIDKIEEEEELPNE